MKKQIELNILTLKEREFINPEDHKTGFYVLKYEDKYCRDEFVFVLNEEYGQYYSNLFYLDKCSPLMDTIFQSVSPSVDPTDIPEILKPDFKDEGMVSQEFILELIKALK